jgi:hypothetical protein
MYTTEGSKPGWYDQCPALDEFLDAVESTIHNYLKTNCLTLEEWVRSAIIEHLDDIRSSDEGASVRAQKEDIGQPGG